MVNRLDRFLAPSPAVAEIHSWYGVNPEKMTVLPSPLDYESLANMERQVDVSARDGQRFRMLFAGRLTREKGVDILLGRWPAWTSRSRWSSPAMGRSAPPWKRCRTVWDSPLR